MDKKKIDMQKLLAPAALVVLYVFFSFVGNNFFSIDTAKNILESSYYIGLMAFGVTFIIITGGIDLSLGTVMMCSALLGAYTFKSGWPLLISVILTILVGVVFGVLNGTMIAKLKLPPFIATLGTQYVSMGIGSIITKVQAQTWPAASAEIGGWFKKALVRTKVFDMIPIGAIWLLVFFVIAALILHKSKFGRYLYAIGSNEEAARLSGINTDKYKIIAYVICGLFASLAALFYVAANPSLNLAAGNGMELDAVAGVYIGGTSTTGGSATIIGSVLGALILVIIRQGLNLAMAGGVNIYIAISLIGAFTFFMSALGVQLGNIFGSRFEKPAQVTGGSILILLGTKILLEGLGIWV